MTEHSTPTPEPASPPHLYVGSWQGTLGERDDTGGITAFGLDQDSGDIRAVATHAPHMAVGAMVASTRRRVLYALNETKAHGEAGFGGSVSAFTVDSTGELRLINTAATAGVFPCAAAIDTTQSWLVVVNYGSEDSVASSTRDGAHHHLAKVLDEASVVLLPLGRDGAVGAVRSLITHERVSGIDPVWQTAPHPHGVAFDPSGRFVVVTDRGADTICVYRLDRDAGRLHLVHTADAPPGSGPRSIRFDPTTPTFYVSCELAPLALCYQLDVTSGGLVQTDSCRTVPPNYRPADPDDFFACPHPSDLAVAPGGRHLYVLNRGHNSVARFQVDPSLGTLAFCGTTPTEGVDPWACDFDPAGRHLYVGNQRSGSVVVFRASAENGELTATGFVGYASKPASLVSFSHR